MLKGKTVDGSKDGLLFDLTSSDFPEFETRVFHRARSLTLEPHEKIFESKMTGGFSSAITIVKVITKVTIIKVMDYPKRKIKKIRNQNQMFSKHCFTL